MEGKSTTRNRRSNILRPIWLSVVHAYGRSSAGSLKGIACALIAIISLPTTASERVTYYYTDGQGTPLVTVDGITGVTTSADYRPYGAQTLGSMQDGPSYTGHVLDVDTELMYMQARYYDPMVGRFLSLDAVGPSPGNVFNFNRQSYGNNNPIFNVDPDGRVVTSTQSANNVRLAAYVNETSRTQFAFDSDDRLVATNAAENPNGSSYYSAKVAAMIAAPTSNLVSIAQTAADSSGKIIDVDADAGGGLTVERSDGSVATTISGNANTKLFDVSGAPLQDGPAYILLHEIVGHGAPITVGPDTGNAVRNENKARSEIPGAGQRASEPNHVENEAITKCGILCSK